MIYRFAGCVCFCIALVSCSSGDVSTSSLPANPSSIDSKSVTHALLPKANASALVPESLFSSSNVPGTITENDGAAVELGIKLSSSQAGTISAIKFYKGPKNVSTHIAHVWSANGTLLASVTFQNETASGWQQQALASPVPIAAGTTYVVSYHTKPGYYSADNSYFNNGLTSGTLSVPVRGGAYQYGSGGFPTQVYLASNYWVDVVFNPSGTLPPSPTPLPSSSPTGAPPTSAPTNLKAGSGNGVVDLTWSAATGATSYNVYGGTAPGAESTTAIKTGITDTTYLDTGLTNGTTYYYKAAAASNGTSGLSTEASAMATAPQYTDTSYSSSNDSNAGMPSGYYTLNWAAGTYPGLTESWTSNLGYFDTTWKNPGGDALWAVGKYFNTGTPLSAQTTLPVSINAWGNVTGSGQYIWALYGWFGPTPGGQSHEWYIVLNSNVATFGSTSIGSVVVNGVTFDCYENSNPQLWAIARKHSWNGSFDAMQIFKYWQTHAVGNAVFPTSYYIRSMEWQLETGFSGTTSGTIHSVNVNVANLAP